MIEGFCIAEQDDVPIGSDRRCLTDGSLTIPPSTGCPHQRFVNGAWSACDPSTWNNQAKPCKPVAPGTYRVLLKQQAGALAKRENDRKQRAAALGQHGRLTTHRTLAAFPERDGVPKTAPRRAPRQRSPRRSSTPSSSDVLSPRPPRRPRESLVPVPCPMCGTRFIPKLHHGQRQMTCSKSCGERYKHAQAASQNLKPGLPEHMARMRAVRNENRHTTWGPSASECKGCGTKDRPHRARGLCERCYNRDYWHRTRRSQQEIAS